MTSSARPTKLHPTEPVLYRRQLPLNISISFNTYLYIIPLPPLDFPSVCVRIRVKPTINVVIAIFAFFAFFAFFAYSPPFV